MATTFEIVIAGEGSGYAAQASAAAFAEVDRVEKVLSRYAESSDVSQINNLAPGEAARVGEHTIECLKVAARAHALTGGAFDVTVGPLIACRRNPDRSLRAPSDDELAAARALVGMGHIEIDGEAHAVQVRVPDVQVDLGGIGKGYAVDQAALILKEWSIEAALISAGGSTVLALDTPPGEAGWPVGVGGVGDQPEAPFKIALRDKALSGSGTHLKGRHIVDPRTGRSASGKLATWALCRSAAMADALSTAFMVMTPAEVEAYCRNHPDTNAMLVLEGKENERLRFGQW